MICFTCGGSGKYDANDCFTCQGLGAISPDRAEYLLTIVVPDSMERFKLTRGAKGISPRTGEFMLEKLRQAMLEIPTSVATRRRSRV